MNFIVFYNEFGDLFTLFTFFTLFSCESSGASGGGWARAPTLGPRRVMSWGSQRSMYGTIEESLAHPVVEQKGIFSSIIGKKMKASLAHVLW